MNREEYLNELKKYLKELPASDYENAMEYFTEYLEEIDDGTALEELGTPEEAAAEIINSLLDRSREKAEGDKKSLKRIGVTGGIVCLLCCIIVGGILFARRGYDVQNSKTGAADGRNESGATVNESGNGTGNTGGENDGSTKDGIVTWRKDDIRFSSISGIEAEFSCIDLQIRASGDDDCHLSYELRGRKGENPLSYRVEEGILKLVESGQQSCLWDGQMVEVEKGKWVSWNSRVTLSVPPGTTFRNVSFQMEEGDLSVQGMRCDEMRVDSGEGDVAIRESTVSKAAVVTAEGDITLSKFSAADKVNIQTAEGDVTIRESTVPKAIVVTAEGDITLSQSSAADEVNIQTTEGDVKTSALTLGGSIKITTKDGDVSLPDIGMSGKIDITSECGDISLGIREEAVSALEMVLDTGDGEIEAQDLFGGSKRSGHYEKQGSGGGSLNGYTREGDISVSLSKQ